MPGPRVIWILYGFFDKPWLQQKYFYSDKAAFEYFNANRSVDDNDGPVLQRIIVEDGVD